MSILRGSRSQGWHGEASGPGPSGEFDVRASDSTSSAAGGSTEC
ncbi:hypothetical protein O1W68_04445 [Rhodococcus sp. H36-A4]|nr:MULTISPECIES: hypothetical protein [unclassified Rhodococcus (in: high G+C Gram-positive bacteria)]MCZ4077182.1 hypothetical protein [Rhodococcus sp. H36-A4]MDJ0359551.1 hypothetical protein [Rhodococcus sp. H29-C3]